MKDEIFKEETFDFGFPIKGSNEETKIKNISHSSLPNFHGLSKNIMTPSSSSSTYFVEAMTIFQMPRN
jgi:hypothetical protein